MKNVFLILVLMTAVIACKTSDKKTETGAAGPVLTPEEKIQATADSSNFTSIAWLDSTTIKLGTVKKGEMVEVAFRFRNTGDKQLIISDVQAGCGCTVPEKPEQPFAPGAEGVIRARFDSKNQHAGTHTKPVTVTANTRPSTIHQLNFLVEITE